jgi:hypothetical protein
VRVSGNQGEVYRVQLFIYYFHDNDMFGLFSEAKSFQCFHDLRSCQLLIQQKVHFEFQLVHIRFLSEDAAYALSRNENHAMHDSRQQAAAVGSQSELLDTARGRKLQVRHQ